MSEGLNVNEIKDSNSNDSSAASMRTLKSKVDEFTAKNKEGNSTAGAEAKQKAESISNGFSNINGAISSAWSNVGAGINAVYQKLSEELEQLDSSLAAYIAEIEAIENDLWKTAETANEETDDFINVLKGI